MLLLHLQDLRKAALVKERWSGSDCGGRKSGKMREVSSRAWRILRAGERVFQAPRWPHKGPNVAHVGPKMAQDGPKMAPRWLQDGPKMAPYVLPEGYYIVMCYEV